MKLLLLIISLSITLNLFSQIKPDTLSSSNLPEHKDSVETTFRIVEVMPSFPGGDNALFQFLATHVQYPQKALINNIKGRVICQFTIGKDGVIRDVEVVRSVHLLLDNEAVRIIKMMPKWIPGMHENEPVAVRYTLPVNFNLK